MCERLPRKPRPGEQKRSLLTTPKIDGLLDGNPPHATLAPRLADLLIADFCAGYLVAVSARKPRTSREKKKKRPSFERLEGFDEIWVMCDRSLPPGWRVLGRFVEAGVFVALRAYPKEDISSDYQKEAKEVLEIWNDVLRGVAPFRSDAIEAYFKGNARNLDDQVF